MKNKKLKLISFFFIITFIYMFITITNVKAITITTGSDTLTGDSTYKKVTNTGNFKIYNTGSSFDKSYFKLQKLVDVFYNSSKDEIKYQFTTDFKTFLSSSSCPSQFKNMTIDTFMSLNVGDATRDNGIVSGGNISTSDFGTLMSKYANYVFNKKIDSDGTLTKFDETSTSTYNGYRYNSGIAVGTYLVLPFQSGALYSVMVDSVGLEKNGSTWEIKDGQVYSKKYDNSSGSAMRHLILKNGVSVNEDFQNKIVLNIPSNYPINSISEKQLEIIIYSPKSDDISNFSLNNGITIESTGNLKLNGSVIGSVGTLNSNGSITFYFTNTSNLLGKSLEITYQAKPLSLNNIVLAGSGNTYDASFRMQGPYSSPDTAYIGCTSVSNRYHDCDIFKSDESDLTGSARVSIYVYALQITGTTGAEFMVKNSSGTSMGTVIIGSDGTGELKGLAEGTYTVTQTKAPAGYALISGSRTVKVGYEGTPVSGKTGYFGITIKNSAFGIIPFTGSIGTIIFTFFGSLLIIGSIIIFIIYKKKKRKDIV